MKYDDNDIDTLLMKFCLSDELPWGKNESSQTRLSWPS